MTEALKGKESLSEKEAVRENTRSGLKALREELDEKLKLKEIKRRTQYLKRQVFSEGKKSYEEIMKENSRGIIKSVQYLLNNLGYDCGEPDGILITKGKNTSKTMEAIKKFQRDINKIAGYNSLRVDGLPGQETIFGLLEMYELIDLRDGLGLRISGLTLNSLTSLTDEEAILLSKKHSGINLYRVKKITDTQAELLSDFMKLSLGIISITDKQAESLSKVSHLELNRLKSITDAQAKSLSKVDHLELYGLKRLTDAQAKSLSKVRDLRLNGLTSITNNQAESLSKVGHLELCGLKSITDKQAESLSKVKSLIISSEILTPKQKRILRKI